MKYILLMSGTRAGVEGYHAWSKQDVNAHMAVLQRINKDLTASGEFVATQGLADPREAKVVRGEKNGVPVTDGVFPESKEFLLGYWIVDVARFPQLPDPGANLPTCRSKSGSSQPMDRSPIRRMSRTPASFSPHRRAANNLLRTR